ncbi:hypothetical protein A2686_03965 [Candidatus Woesebacteria bacterium RIFCSPHIGHO2_01_FULL_38_10]|uniref:Rhodanese domain-containing protein n=1 Tax=Candidatus Woesebacteria bacterium RIFCSPLOWO2_01_FULL_39_10b TaxID=1802517 RepID=A0A1F8B7J4_9BACT|nr:MAG: hypothetical protein A2686_03965 [Candidatus Woesebacteria bacterium RIFCSPHIGHO2_01_FULL_38_10]OGM60003.1 MAG: hypothetical protein A2892_03850 [Candidatus Woesebacteria bacterium RIFCSPLOWO2_01_FULL_39_10b]
MKRKQRNKKFLAKLTVFSLLILFGFLLGLRKEKLLEFLPGSFSRSTSLKVDKGEIISPRDLKKALSQKDFIFINVHTPYEGEVEKTDLFIDYDLLVANKDKLPQDKNSKIVLYCKTDRMSADALATLKSLGYTNIKHLKGGMDAWRKQGFDLLDLTNLPSQVLPDQGFELPISWGKVVPRLVALGVIDKEKFEKAVNMGEEEKLVFAGNVDIPIKINSQNSQFVVDVLWALGLAQKSLVYEEGPMGREYKDRAGNFASTGGWTLAKGSAMTHYNTHELIPLTAEDQIRVMEIAQNIYRPCCGNPTSFPDCNHGMAALAAIELMVVKGLPDEEIYKNVLKLNSFWFSSHYLTLATSFVREGISWDKVDAKLALGSEYSSGNAAVKLNKKVGPLPFEANFAGGCGA